MQHSCLHKLKTTIFLQNSIKIQKEKSKREALQRLEKLSKRENKSDTEKLFKSIF